MYVESLGEIPVLTGRLRRPEENHIAKVTELATATIDRCSVVAVVCLGVVWIETTKGSLALAAAFVLMVALVVAWPKYTTSSAV